MFSLCHRVCFLLHCVGVLGVPATAGSSADAGAGAWDGHEAGAAETDAADESHAAVWLWSTSGKSYPYSLIGGWGWKVRSGFHPGFFNWGGPASVPLCSHPRYTRWGGDYWGGTDFIGPVGSGALPIMHCAPIILSKIGINVWNPGLCALLQGRIQGFATGGLDVC